MNHEHEQDRASSPVQATTSHEELKPGQSSRSAMLRKPEHAVASGLVQRKAWPSASTLSSLDQSQDLLRQGAAEEDSRDRGQGELDNTAIQRRAAMNHAESPLETGPGLVSMVHGSELKEQEPAPVEPEVDLPSGGGSALPDKTRGELEDHFGVDLSSVRVHTGAEAAEQTNRFESYAFTYGTDIYFGPGQYAPDTTEGKHLLTHEVAHVMQQANGETGALRGEGGDASSREALERQADQHADSNAEEAARKAPTSRDGISDHHLPPQRSMELDPIPLPQLGGGGPVQKKAIQKEAWPGGPSGDKVERIDFVDTSTIISLVKSQCRNLDIEQNGLTGHLLNLFSGDYFYGSSAWTSGWIDDGWNDTWSAGLSDVDMKVDIQLSIANPKERKADNVDSTGTASGSGTSANTNSSTTTAGGNAEASGSVGGSGKPGGGGKVGGSLSQADTTTTTTGNTGSRSDTASYKNKRMIADVKMTVNVKYNATIPGASFSPNTQTFKIGNVIYLRKDL